MVRAFPCVIFFPFSPEANKNVCLNNNYQDELKVRLSKLEANAKNRVQESDSTTNANHRANRVAYVPKEPIIIASTEDIGTIRVRANHLDASIHYFMEQEALKKNNAPIV